MRGRLLDRQGTRDRQDDEPVADAEVVVADGAGEEVDRATSDEDGRWEVPLPGPGEYSATLDTDTLPDDVSLAEDRDQVSFRVTPNQNRTVIFDLGARQREVTNTFERFLQLSVEGVKFGLVIAIAAIGLSLIFGTTGLTNFAHGELVTFGAVVAWYLNVRAGIQLIPATVLAVGVGLAAGALIERGLWRPLRRQGMGLVAMMVVSIGLGLLLRNILLYFFGGSSRPYADYFGQRAWEWGSVTIAPRDLVAIVLSVAVLLAVAFVLQRTRFGKVTRVLMFAGITLGGLGTAYGALLGSFIVGWFVNVSTLWVSPDLKNIGALVVLILILLVRPQGILGTAERVG
ncbi:MAG: inner-rane translocator [Acidimicrobiales bacterium]|nr:inner-rane translocator [Acidimicrobiales bacterium]